MIRALTLLASTLLLTGCPDLAGNPVNPEPPPIQNEERIVVLGENGPSIADGTDAALLGSEYHWLHTLAVRTIKPEDQNEAGPMITIVGANPRADRERNTTQVWTFVEGFGLDLVTPLHLAGTTRIRLLDAIATGQPGRVQEVFLAVAVNDGEHLGREVVKIFRWMTDDPIRTYRELFSSDLVNAGTSEARLALTPVDINDPTGDGGAIQLLTTGIRFNAHREQEIVTQYLCPDEGLATDQIALDVRRGFLFGHAAPLFVSPLQPMVVLTNPMDASELAAIDHLRDDTDWHHVEGFWVLPDQNAVVSTGMSGPPDDLHANMELCAASGHIAFLQAEIDDPNASAHLAWSEGPEDYPWRRWLFRPTHDATINTRISRDSSPMGTCATIGRRQNGSQLFVLEQNTADDDDDIEAWLYEGVSADEPHADDDGPLWTWQGHHDIAFFGDATPYIAAVASDDEMEIVITLRGRQLVDNEGDMRHVIRPHGVSEDTLLLAGPIVAGQ